MAGSDIGRSSTERVRRRIGGTGLQARNTQAARDALRRRQKEKKARIVKRHVRYKDKKKLLEQLAQSERPTPIVAKELCRDDEEDLEAMQEPSVQARTPIVHKDDDADDSALAENDQREIAVRENADVDSKVCTDVPADDSGEDDDSVRQDRPLDKPAKRQKYIPFMKEQKEYERMKEEREAEQSERRRKIEEREQMLQRSKKQRRAKVSIEPTLFNCVAVYSHVSSLPRARDSFFCTSVPVDKC